MDGLDPATERRIDESVAALVASWPPLTERQRDVVRNAFRSQPQQDTDAA